MWKIKDSKNTIPPEVLLFFSEICLDSDSGWPERNKSMRQMDIDTWPTIITFILVTNIQQLIKVKLKNIVKTALELQGNWSHLSSDRKLNYLSFLFIALNSSVRCDQLRKKKQQQIKHSNSEINNCLSS